MNLAWVAYLLFASKRVLLCWLFLYWWWFMDPFYSSAEKNYHSLFLGSPSCNIYNICLSSCLGLWCFGFICILSSQSWSSEPSISLYGRGHFLQSNDKIYFCSDLWSCHTSKSYCKMVSCGGQVERDLLQACSWLGRVLLMDLTVHLSGAISLTPEAG